jgi:C2 domain
MEPLMIKLMDKDRFNKDDVTATVQINIESIFKTPGVWTINEKYPMIFEEKTTFPPEKTPAPEVYLQVKYLSKQMIEAKNQGEPQPKLKYELLSEIKKSRIDGKMIFKIIYAKELKAIEDPTKCKLYSTIEYGDIENKLKTPYVENTHTPKFDDSLNFEFDLNLESVTFLKKVQVLVK